MRLGVLGFEVDPYIDIDTVELPFSLEDLQHLRYHFEVFLVVSLFGPTTDKENRVARLDTYLDTRNARIAYEERARKTLQGQNQTSASNMLEDNNHNESGLGAIP